MVKAVDCNSIEVIHHRFESYLTQKKKYLKISECSIKVSASDLGLEDIGSNPIIPNIFNGRVAEWFKAIVC